MIITTKNKIYITWSAVTITLLIGIAIGGYYFFTKCLDSKVAIVEQEQLLFTEQFNKKLVKLNKSLAASTEENKNLQSFNKELEIKLEDSRFIQQDLYSKLEELNNKKSHLEKSYHTEKNTLQKQINLLTKDNAELQALVKELQQQIKNHKNNSYGLFQAGKLEVELTNVDQELSEYYEHINQKKHNLSGLKDKCGKLRTNSKFCKEHDANVASIATLEQQIEHLKNKREDLKKRINTYLSMSKNN